MNDSRLSSYRDVVPIDTSNTDLHILDPGLQLLTSSLPFFVPSEKSYRISLHCKAMAGKELSGTENDQRIKALAVYKTIDC